MRLARLGVWLLALPVLVVTMAGPVSAAAPPAAVAAVGDSITTATDVGWCCVDPGGGNPEYSWSTGSSSDVNSLHSQLAAVRRSKGQGAVGAVNLAKPGASSADLDAQLTAAAAVNAGKRRVGYVTVLIGGNDLCVRSVAAMTDPAVFRQRVRSAFTDFFRAVPNGRMFVASIPNLYQLWQVEHDELLAQLTWDTFNICPSMLNSSRTEAERQLVLQREQELNGILADECAQFARCRWDGYAVYRVRFDSNHVSPVDHYHPSVAGQRLLAKIAARAFNWPG